jgi:hypothetical protein
VSVLYRTSGETQSPVCQAGYQIGQIAENTAGFTDVFSGIGDEAAFPENSFLRTLTSLSLADRIKMNGCSHIPKGGSIDL